MSDLSEYVRSMSEVDGDTFDQSADETDRLEARIKELESMYEAALPVAEFLRGDDGVTDVDVTDKFVAAIDAVQKGDN